VVVFSTYPCLWAQGTPNKVSSQPSSGSVDQLSNLLSSLQIFAKKDLPVAPDFTLPDLQQKKMSLNQTKGKVVFLHFWATWCGPCREELPALEEFYRNLDKTKYEMLAISADQGGKAVVESFLGNQKYKMPILLDPTGQVVAKYGVRAFPTTLILSPNHKILAEINGARDWLAVPMMKLLSIIGNSTDVETDFKKAADSSVGIASSEGKEPTNEDIKKILPLFDIKVNADKSHYSLGDTIHMSIVFKWSEKDKNAFFIRPPQLPEVKGLELKHTDLRSTSQKTQKVLSYNLKIKSLAVGVFNIDPINISYILYGFEKGIEKKIKGLKLEVRGQQLLGFPRWVVITGLLILVVCAVFLSWFVKKRRHKLKAINEKENQRKMFLNTLQSVQSQMREAKLKRDSRSFLQGMTAIKKAYSEDLNLPISLSFFEDLDESKKEQILFGGGEFSEAEISYCLNKIEDNIKKTKEFMADQVE